MLDVHPPHHPTNSWRDFFVHIATISVGLLIAIGLEQTVEAFHREHERNALIDDIHVECENNVKVLEENLQIIKAKMLWQRAAVAALRDAPMQGGSFTVTLPVEPNIGTFTPSNAVWSNARASGSVGLLPENLAEVFDRVDLEARQWLAVLQPSNDSDDHIAALALRLGVPVTSGGTLHLTAAEREDAIAVITESYARSHQCAWWGTLWLGASRSVLAGVQTRAEMGPYIDDAKKLLPENLR